MPKQKRPTPSTAAQAPPVYSPAAGKKALAALAPALAAVDPADFVSLKLDVETATFAALGVAGFLADPKVRGRFASLPKKEFDVANVDGLAPSCFATLYAIGEARAAGALESDAKVPTDLAAEAAEVEARMAALCEYQLADDPEIRPELDRLRPGSGHRDVAGDLLGYARIYDLRPAVVKADAKHYRPGDAAKARELAGAIIQALSAAMTPKARAAQERFVRAWTLLFGRYGEVREAGLWLFRKDADRERRFPSLFLAGRPNVGQPKKTRDQPATPANVDGGAATSEK